ncbi:hypothetical protein [Spirosoma utsteinense]|uniref:Uncharacterized protein n=1 Tax=Spirosoma utsteinense TaxID=2585773 RepID=A0ABR6WD38_9BACT|nr:hypothetical protein [Spirosoma utsteinense]MBC3788483.1 hypothetical protein [Spirosoma utsteinense]MBC3794451.1 hypothetical protein [Spirosoma utsteinense]
MLTLINALPGFTIAHTIGYKKQTRIYTIHRPNQLFSVARKQFTDQKAAGHPVAWFTTR